MRSLLSYAQAFIERYGARLVDVSIVDIVGSVMSSNLLAAIFRAAYLRYIEAFKMMINHINVSPLLMYSGIDEPAVKTLGITHFDDLNLYNSSEKDNFPPYYRPVMH